MPGVTRLESAQRRKQDSLGRGNNKQKAGHGECARRAGERAQAWGSGHRHASLEQREISVEIVWHLAYQ